MGLGSRSKSARTDSPPGFYVRAVTLSNSHELSFKSGEIVLVVGPNNSGKSTFLRNIRDALQKHDAPRKMLSEVDFEISPELVRSRLREVYNIQELEHQWYILNEEGQLEFGITLDEMEKGRLNLRKAANAFAVTLNAETRLSLSNPVETLDIEYSRPTHPYHHFLLSRDLLRRFAVVARDAFGMDFTISRIGNPIRGYVGAAFRNDLDSLEEDQHIPRLGERIETQGDGIRSYIGIAAEFVGSSHPIVLLDEPEAFLHPPQAKKLGRLIITSLPNDRQSFIATHSSDFLQGVLSSRPARVTVIRVDRSQGKLQSNALENNQLQAALAHPSLANTNLLDSLFFTQTVICEGDADCGLFDWAIRELGGEDIKAIDRFWFATGGKHQTPKIAKLLATFGVDFRVVLDLDALADWELITKLTALKRLDISPFKKRIRSGLAVLQRPTLNEVLKEIVRVLEGKEFADEETERRAIREVYRVLGKSRNSQPLKQHGLSAFRNGQERADAEEFLRLLGSHGIILLSAGETESYVPEIGLHGPGWAAAVLEDLPSHKSKLRQLLADIQPGLL